MDFMDLHTHSHYSDGTNCPAQNIIDGAHLGLNIMALTDHDTTKGISQAQWEASMYGIKLLTGVEISVPCFHILGYEFNVDNRNLLDLLAHSRTLQEAIVRRRIELLQSAGVPITFEKVRFRSLERLGRCNILYCMIKDPDCRKFHGVVSQNDLRERYFKPGGIAANVDTSNQVSAKDAIDAIHGAGGYAILAHPFKNIKDPNQLTDMLALGLDGLEVQPNYGRQNDFYKALAEKRDLIVTYGSDYHGSTYPSRPLLSKASLSV